MHLNIHPDTGMSLRAHNTLAVESQAEYCVRVDSDDTLRQAILWAAEKALPITVLGEGSNVLLHKQLPGLVLLMENCGVDLISDDGRYVTLHVAAGENWHSFVSWCVKSGFYGLENLALIPGTVGAAPVQNIGAYGVEVADWISAVHVRDAITGEARILSREDCQFAYRDSIFKSAEGAHWLIAAVDFRLDRNAEPNIIYPVLRAKIGDTPATPQRVFDAVQAIRKERLPDPSAVPNVGSFFKNPEVDWHQAELMSMRWPDMPQHPTGSGGIKLSAAWMIDHLGWRGKAHEGAAVDDKHALILINAGTRSVRSFLDLAQMIAQDVFTHFSVQLEIEPRILGKD